MSHDLTRRHVSIREDQDEDADDANINLSAFIRDAIDEAEWSRGDDE